MRYSVRGNKRIKITVFSLINHLNRIASIKYTKIEKFRMDEIHHKNIAYEKGATKKGLYSIMDKLIKTGSKIAINISEKI